MNFIFYLSFDTFQFSLISSMSGFNESPFFGVSLSFMGFRTFSMMFWSIAYIFMRLFLKKLIYLKLDQLKMKFCFKEFISSGLHPFKF